MSVETGAWRGRSAVAIASALRDNGGGRLWSIEMDPEAADAARRALDGSDLGEWAEVVEGSSLAWRPPARIDLAFLDSAASIRGLELIHLYRRMHRRTVLIVHDTGIHKRQPRRQLQILARLGLVAVVWCPTPRGLTFAQPRFPLGWRTRLAIGRSVIGRGVPVLHRAEDRAMRLRNSLRRRGISGG